MAKETARESPQGKGKGGEESKAEEERPTEAPLGAHLEELRQRLLFALSAWGVAFLLCIFFASDLFSFLLAPYASALPEGRTAELIYTAPQEYFFTQLKLALFGGFILGFPIIAHQLYRFAAPGLYRHERRAFLPFLLIAPLLFLLGAALVHYGILPLALQFFLAMETQNPETKITMLPRVSEYLSLAMTLIIAFGLCFQLPVLLGLLARAGLITAEGLRKARKYAVIGIFAVAALLTPPDIVSQLGLALPTLLLYEISILAASWNSKRDDST